MRSIRALPLCGLLGLFLGSPVLAGADARFDAAVAKLQAEIRKATGRDRAQVIDQAVVEALPDLRLGQVTFEQVEVLDRSRILGNSIRVKKELAPRLSELAKATTLEGAFAASLAASNYPMVYENDRPRYADEVGRCEALKRAFRHPAIGELTKTASTRGSALFVLLGYVNFSAAKETRLAEELPAVLDHDFSPFLAGFLVDAFMFAHESGGDISPTLKESIRSKCLACVAKSFGSLDAKEKANESMYSHGYKLRWAKAFLNGAWAKGQLLGRTAPAVPFRWCSQSGCRSLADLSGKKVLAVFFSPWASAFEEVWETLDELKPKADALGVTLVGVTSIVGFVMDPEYDSVDDDEANPYVGKPDLEIADWEKIHARRGTKWMRAWSQADARNPDFGFYYLPSAVLIREDGVVVTNSFGLDEGANAVEAKLKALLK